MKYTQLLFVLARIFTDFFMILSGLIIAFSLRMYGYDFIGLEAPITAQSFDFFTGFSVLISIFLVGVFAVNGRYRFGSDPRLFDEISQLFWNFSAGLALLLVFFFFIKFTFFSRFILGMAWVAGFVLLVLGRTAIRCGKWLLLKKGLYRANVLIIGTNKLGEKLYQGMKHDINFNIVGFLTHHEQDSHNPGAEIHGSVDDFERLWQQLKVTQVILAHDDLHDRSIQKIIQTCHINELTFEFLPDQVDVDLTSIEVHVIHNQPVIKILNTRMMGWGLVVKYFFDRIIALIALIVLSPLLLILFIIIKLADPNASAFYAAPRVGKNAKHFLCYKFRSMIPNAEDLKEDLIKVNERAGGVFFKMEHDPRVTRFGSFIRKTSLDELPQIFNILKGDMSWVGPRPHLPEEVDKYTSEDLRLIGVRPGITGFAQVNGLSNLSFQDEMKYELYYLKNWSWWLDAIIFVKTIWIVGTGGNRIKTTSDNT